MYSNTFDQNWNRVKRIMQHSAQFSRNTWVPESSNQTPEASDKDYSCAHPVMELNCLLRGERSKLTSRVIGVNLETNLPECKHLLFNKSCAENYTELINSVHSIGLHQ